MASYFEATQWLIYFKYLFLCLYQYFGYLKAISGIIVLNLATCTVQIIIQEWPFSKASISKFGLEVRAKI